MKKLIIKENQKKVLLLENFETTNIHFKKNSSANIFAIIKDGWTKEKKLNFYFEGQNSKLTFICIFIGTKKEKFIFQTNSYHDSKHTQAHYYINSLLQDKSSIDYQGNIIIRPGAQNTDTYLSHNTLLLSDYAKAQTTPSLEIEANKIKASHSATIGKIDEELLFYLKSKGIKEKNAKQLLVKAFLMKDIKKLNNKSTQKLIIQKIEASI